MYFYFQLFILRKKPTHPSLNRFNRLSFIRPSSSLFPPIEQASAKSLLQQCVFFLYFYIFSINIYYYIMFYYTLLYYILFYLLLFYYILCLVYIMFSIYYYVSIYIILVYVSIYIFFKFNFSVCGRARVGRYTYNIQCKI